MQRRRFQATWELVPGAIWYCLAEDDETEMPPPPARLVADLDLAKTPGQIEEILARWEKRIAHMCKSAIGDYLPCYNANFLFSDILQAKKMPHKVVYGHTGDGVQDHVWIIAGGKNYDMTRQGFSKKFEVWYSYTFPKGPTKFANN